MQYSCFPHSENAFICMTLRLICYYRSHKAHLLPNSLLLSLLISLHPPFLFSPALSLLLLSDYIIKEKTVLLQKKDNEGFGFVLRGAKGEPLLIVFCLYTFFQTHMLFLSNLSIHTHALVRCSSDSHRGVHSNTSVPRAAVPGVCR